MSFKKVYSVMFSATVLSGATGTANFAIPLNQRQTKVRSVTWTWWGRVLGSNQIINQYTNSTQALYMTLAAVSGLPLASFVNVAAPTPAGINGAGFRISVPGTYQFDTFYAQNDLTFNFQEVNYDLLNSVQYELTLIIELQIL